MKKKISAMSEIVQTYAVGENHSFRHSTEANDHLGGQEGQHKKREASENTRIRKTDSFV